VAFSVNIFKSRYLISIGLLVSLGFAIIWFVKQFQIPFLYDPESSQVHHVDTVVTLGNELMPDQRIGQTLRIRRNNINSITVWLSLPASEAGSIPYLHFSLHPDVDKSSTLYRASYQLPNRRFAGPFRISFSSLDLPRDQSVYFELQASNGPVDVHGSLDDFYPYGAAYVNGNASNADLSFSITYAYNLHELSQDILNIARNLYLLLPLFLTIILPGWLVVNLLGIHRELDFWSLVGLSGGISLAIVPLIMMWANLIGLHWDKNVSLLFSGLAIGLGFWFLLDNIFRKGKLALALSHKDLAMVGILILSIILRTAMIRDYAAPLWVDSVHHGLITRLIQEQGTLFIDYWPHFNIPPTSYHTGFHASLALFQSLSGLELPLALLVFGQALNVAAILATYLLAYSLTNKPVVGIWSALAVGLLMPLPAYLTSWGRYTHLAGMLIFSSCVFIFSSLLNTIGTANSNHNISSQSLPSLNMTAKAIALGSVISGLFLVHYRVAAFLGLWIGIILLPKVIVIHASKNKQIFSLLLIAVITGALLGGPWLLPALEDTFIPRLSSVPSNIPRLFADFDVTLFTVGYGGFALGFSTLGIVFGIFKKHWITYIILLWTTLLFLGANLGALGLPGGQFVNHISIQITLFPVLGYLFGFGIYHLEAVIKQFFPVSLRKIWQMMVMTVIMLFSINGAARLISITNPNTALARQADIAAIAWIKDNVPVDEEFLISPFTWGYGLCAGYDGGFFISSFAGNKTYPSPILYGLGSIEQRRDNNAICDKLESTIRTSLDLWQFLSEKNIHYIYLGARGGKLTPSLIADPDLFETVYQQDGVWIARIKLGG
jgi:hypothetical protein